MKLKQWLLALMASIMIVGVVTGCTNEEEPEDPATEENQDAETEEGTEEGTEEEPAE